jgi:hypothetical protein
MFSNLKYASRSIVYWKTVHQETGMGTHALSVSVILRSWEIFGSKRSRLYGVGMIKSLAKQLPHPFLCRLYHQVHLREESSRAAKAASRTGLPLLKSLDLRRLRTSETLFILGSAWSINDISDERWRIISQHDSVGFNFWLAHPFVPRMFVFESAAYNDHPVMYDAFRPLLERRAGVYANTMKIITDVRPLGPRQMIFELPEGIKENLYVGYTTPVIARNEEELEAGIRYMRSIGAFTPGPGVAWLFKYGGSVIAMMSLAVLMGHKRIILCGIDLGKQDYFYHHRERYPDYAGWEFAPRKDNHLTTRRLEWMVPAHSVIRIYKQQVLDPAGIELFVESRASTLYPGIPLATDSVFEELALQPLNNSDSTSHR